MAHEKVTILCRVPRSLHTAKIQPLPCALLWAHGKEAAFAMCQAGEAHGKGSCYVILAVEPKRLPWVRFDTRQRLCRVLEILHTAKAAFADGCLLYALCRVRHTAKPLPCTAHGKQGVSRSD